MIDELELLRAWDPTKDDIDPQAAVRARALLHAHAAATAAASRARSRRRSRRRWTLGLAAAAAAVAAAIVALASGLEDGHVRPQRATAAEVLEHAARAAERHPAREPFPAPDQYFYVRSQGGNLSCVGDGHPFCAYVVRRRETWQSFTREGRLVGGTLGHSWPGPQERRRWLGAGRPLVTGPAVAAEPLPRLQFWLGNRRLSYLELLAYRPSPQALYRDLRAGVSPGQGPSPDGEVFTMIGDALREQPAPPELRAALYRALKLVPGVRLGGEIRDRLGRRAVVVARTEGDTRRELLFDPSTWAMIGEREVSVRRGAFGMADALPGTVLADVVYERHAVVDRAGLRPR